MKFQEKGFTLVELMVVVVILGVLGAVGIVSYSSYLWGSRDSNRLTQLSDIKSWLSIYTAKGRALPLPENSIDILAWANIVAYQGYAWEKTLGLIGYQDGGTDPLDDTYFTYYIDKTKKSFQLMGFLEEDTNLAYSPIPQSYAEDIDYSERIPTVTGSKLGALVEQGTNTPVQEIGTLSSGIDITGTSQTYHAYYSDSQVISGSGAVLGQTIANQNCKRLLDLGRHNGSGIYRISPTGVSDIQVYCDMETDWGGWTHIGSKIDGGNNVTGDFWVVATRPGVAANVTISQDGFRNNLTQALACSTENCWAFDISSAFKTCLQNSCTTQWGLVNVERVSGTTGLQSIVTDSFRYNYNTTAHMFDLRNGSSTDGVWWWSQRRNMTGAGYGSWQVWNQWDIYVR